MTEDRDSDADLDHLNTHQQDVRARGQSLARAVAIIAGGALSVSIGVFARHDSPQLIPSAATSLWLAWWALFSALVLLTLAPLIILGRDYVFGEQWRDLLDGKRSEARDRVVWVEVTIWSVALTGYAAFVVGMFALAYTASTIVG